MSTCGSAEVCCRHKNASWLLWGAEQHGVSRRPQRVRKMQKARRRPFKDSSGFLILNPAALYSPTPIECSTIDAVGLNFRVRNGNGWNPHALTTGKRVLLALTDPNRWYELPGIWSLSRKRHRSDFQKVIMHCSSVKPHGRLVRVSSIHCCTYTSRLSTR